MSILRQPLSAIPLSIIENVLPKNSNTRNDEKVSSANQASTSSTVLTTRYDQLRDIIDKFVSDQTAAFQANSIIRELEKEAVAFQQKRSEDSLGKHSLILKNLVDNGLENIPDNSLDGSKKTFTKATQHMKESFRTTEILENKENNAKDIDENAILIWHDKSPTNQNSNSVSEPLRELNKPLSDIPIAGTID
jgi:hypothetical protein